MCFKMKKRTWHGTALALMFPPVFTWLSPQLQCSDWSYPFWSDQLKFRILSIPARRRTGGGMRHHQSNSLYIKHIQSLISYPQEALNHPLTDLNIFQPDFGPYASRSKCSKSGVTPLARQRPITHHLARGSSYQVAQSSILAEVQGRHCHPAPLPAVPKATYPSVWGWAQAHLSHLSRFSQRK